MLQLPASPRLRPGFTRAPTPPSAPHVIALRAARDSSPRFAYVLGRACYSSGLAHVASPQLRAALLAPRHEASRHEGTRGVDLISLPGRHHPGRRAKTFKRWGEWLGGLQHAASIHARAHLVLQRPRKLRAPHAGGRRLACVRIGLLQLATHERQAPNGRSSDMGVQARRVGAQTQSHTLKRRPRAARTRAHLWRGTKAHVVAGRSHSLLWVEGVYSVVHLVAADVEMGLSRPVTFARADARVPCIA